MCLELFPSNFWGVAEHITLAGEDDVLVLPSGKLMPLGVYSD